jgi:hypothetical protein
MAVIREAGRDYTEILAIKYYVIHMPANDFGH